MKTFPALFVVFSLASGAAAASSTDRAGYCASISSYAEQVMFIRQMDKPIESQMESVRYQFDTAAEQASAQALVQRAWTVERSSTSRDQQKQISRFGESTEAACIAGEIFPA